MKKATKIMLTLILALCLIVTIAACDNPSDNENGDDNGGSNNQPEKIRVTDSSAEGAKMIKGYVGNTQFEKVAGLRILFGEELELAATTDENGLFSFYFVNPNELEASRVVDYIILDSQDYKYKVFEYTHDSSGDTLGCTIVVDQADSDFDMETIVPNVQIRLSFGMADEDFVMLPVGYPTENPNMIDENGLNTEERKAEEHKDTVFGVKLFINEKYYDYSRDSGWRIRYIIPGTVLRLEYPEMYFAIHVPGTTTTVLDGENRDTYTYTLNNGVFIDFRARSENPDVLFDHEEWKDYLED
jgi:hypothetical protein